MIRQPIISVLGHVDHGKTTVLDWIRHSTVAAREAGGITQHIGATEVPIDVIKAICGNLLDQLKMKITFPGILFVDTPGHEAFTNLRRRGGSIADLAMLVIDIREGLMPQTLESIDILKTYKVPFVVLANKIDLLSGWKNTKNNSFLKAFDEQQKFVKDALETKVYELIGALSEHGFEADQFNRISNFAKQVSIVPCSAKTGEGLAELLMVLTGLAQRYLENELETDLKKPGKASILEVKEEQGLGMTLNCVLYDGSIKQKDRIVCGGMNGPIVTRIKALLKPKPLDEMRDPKDKFESFDEVYAASGVKVVAPDIQDALAGAPLYVIDNNEEDLKEQVSKEMGSVRFEMDKNGVIVKADTLGSLEALLKMLKNINVPVRRADIGAVSKKDSIECESVMTEMAEAAILAFNVPIQEEARHTMAKIIESKIIYKLMEDYEKWRVEAKRLEEKNIFKDLPRPAELFFLPNHTFRRSSPAIIGVEVRNGKLRKGCTLMKEDGIRIGHVLSIQEKNAEVEEADRGDKVAISIDGPLVGRQINEGDTLYTYVSDIDYERLMLHGRKLLTPAEQHLLMDIMKIVRSRV